MQERFDNPHELEACRLRYRDLKIRYNEAVSEFQDRISTLEAQLAAASSFGVIVPPDTAHRIADLESQLARSQSDLQVARDRQSALASELRESATSHKAAQAEVVRLEAATKRKNGRLQDRVSAARDTIARLEKWVNQVEKSQKTRQDLESALATLQQEKDALAVQRDELLGQLGERFMEVTDLRAERDQAQERLSNIASLLPSAPSHKRERSGSESPTQSARVSKAARSTSGPSPAGASSRVPASGSSIEVLSAGAASQTAERSVASHSSAGPPDHLPRSVRSATKRGSRDASSSPAAPEADMNSDGDESSSGESGSTH
ncbi:hypothetical protein F444_22834, partial [Phytophthora nicotianae P1976]